MAISEPGQQVEASIGLHSAQPSLRVAVSAESSAAPDQVLAAGYDFSARRAQIWRNVKVKRLEVHESGDAWAVVTEVNFRNGAKGTIAPSINHLADRRGSGWYRRTSLTAIERASADASATTRGGPAR